MSHKLDLLESVNAECKEIKLMEANFIAMSAATEIEFSELTESAREWLNKVENEKVELSDDVFSIMGTIEALCSNDLSAAMNISPERRLALLKIFDSGHKQNKKAFQMMTELGRDEALGFSKKIKALASEEALKNNPEGFKQKAVDLRNKVAKITQM